MKVEVADINSRLKALWADQIQEDDNLRAPLLIDSDIQTGGIVFVGLNPSFSDSRMQSYLKSADAENAAKHSDLEDLFRWESEIGEAQIELMAKVDKIALDKHPYFIKPKEIAEQVDKHFVHLDVFAVRETSQKEALNSLGIKIDKAEGKFSASLQTHFAEVQLDIFYTVLVRSEPVAIVVINAAASKILKEKLNTTPSSLAYCPERGCHFWATEGLVGEAPVFFSGMLSGRRALDLDSVDRLRWHISRTLEK